MLRLVRKEGEDSGGKVATSGRKDRWSCREISNVLSKSGQNLGNREEFQSLKCHSTWTCGLAFVLKLPCF